MSDVEDTGPLANSTLQNHHAFTQIVNQLMAKIASNKRSAPLAELLLRIACHYEGKSLLQSNKPDPMKLFLVLVPGAQSITFEIIIQSLAPPSMIQGPAYNGWFHDETVDHLATCYSRKSHLYIPYFRIALKIPNNKDTTMHLSRVLFEARANRHCTADQRFQYFLVDSIPDDISTVHLVYLVRNHWVHVRLWVDGDDKGRITVHNSLNSKQIYATIIDRDIPLLAAIVALTPGSAWPAGIAWESVTVEFVKCPQQTDTYDCGSYASYALARDMRPELPEYPVQGFRMFHIENMLTFVPTLPESMKDSLALQKASNHLEKEDKKKSKEEKEKEALAAAAEKIAAQKAAALASQIKPDTATNAAFDKWLRELGSGVVADLKDAFRAGAEYGRQSPQPAGQAHKYTAGTDSKGTVAAGASLSVGQYNVSRPPWTPEQIKLLKMAIEEEGLEAFEVSKKYFDGVRTPAAVNAKYWRLEQGTGPNKELRWSKNRKSPTESALLALAHPIFNASQARLIYFVKAGWRSKAGEDAHHLFRYAWPANSDLRDTGMVLVDFRFVVEQCALIPKVQGTRVMPLNVIAAVSLNDYQSSVAGCMGGIMHHWKDDDEQIFYFSASVRWNRSRRREWSGLALYEKMRCSEEEKGWMWHDPDAKVLAVAFVLAEDNDDNTFTAELTVAADEWEAAKKRKGASPVVMFCLPELIIVATLQQLANCSGKHLSSEYKPGTVSFTFRPQVDTFAGWCKDRSLRIEEDLSCKLVRVLHGYHALAESGALEGVELEDWVDIKARLHPGN